MNHSFSWDPSFLEPLVTIGLSLFAILAYWLSILSKSLESFFIKYFGEEKAKIEWIMFWRYAGVIYFALIPAIVVFTVFPHNLAYYGISFVNLSETLLWTLGISALLIFIRSRSPGQPDNLKQYPQIRINNWTAGLFFKNSLGWFIYLLSYEFFFRGILLFGLLEAFGVWPAIMVNTIIYSLAHLPKGTRETLAAVPFGILLCYLTIRTETIWLTVFVHTAMAISNDYFSLAESKVMKFVKD